MNQYPLLLSTFFHCHRERVKEIFHIWDLSEYRVEDIGIHKTLTSISRDYDVYNTEKNATQVI